MLGHIILSCDHLSNTQSSCFEQQNAYWHMHTLKSTTQGKLLTSLLRQAFKCSGFLDMKNCQVVSALGWGPGLSGAYCTLRIGRRAEFLGSSTGQHGGALCLAEPEFCIHMWLHPRRPLISGAKLSKQPRCVTGPSHPH